jgi:hypothetical protein
MRDDTLQPACHKEKCKEDGERWLRSEGLVAQLKEKPHAEGRTAGNSISGMPRIEQNQGSAEKGLTTAATAKRGLQPVKEKEETAEGRAIFEISISGVPEIERDSSCANQNGKADSHAKGCAAQGTSIPGVQRAPEIAQGGNSILGVSKIEQDRSGADQNREASAYAQGYAAQGTSILGAQGAPEIAQGGNSILGVPEI